MRTDRTCSPVATWLLVLVVLGTSPSCQKATPPPPERPSTAPAARPVVLLSVPDGPGPWKVKSKLKVSAEVSGATEAPPDLVMFEFRKVGRPANLSYGMQSVQDGVARGDVLIYEREVSVPAQPGQFTVTAEAMYFDFEDKNAKSKPAPVEAIE